MTSAKTTFLFIRHGQTDWNVIGRWQGHIDTPLNETGQQQARALARRLVSWPIEAVLCSDLQRAQETAVILAQPHQLTPQPDPDWRERHVGRFSGLTSTESREAFPHIWEAAAKGILEPPQGEPFAQLAARMLGVYHRALAHHSGQMVAVVSHGQAIHVLLAQLLGIPTTEYGRFSVRGNTGLSIVEHEHGRSLITCLNDTSHLEQTAGDS